MLQCVAVCCVWFRSVLQYVAVFCSVLCGLEYDVHRQYLHALSCQLSKCFAKSDINLGLRV